jgi:predicted PurR-regulated permease PerM
MEQDVGKKQSRLKSFFTKPSSKAFRSIASLIQTHKEDDTTSNAIISLLKAVIWADGSAKPEEIEAFEKILEPNYSAHKISQLTSELQSPLKVNIEAACKEIADFNENQKIELLRSLIALGFANNDYSEKERKLIKNIANKLTIDKAGLEKIETEVEQSHKTQNNLLKSGAGIIVALIVIAVFILTATLLKSVLFGLILAYIFLPLEKFYERKLLSNGLFAKIFKFFKLLATPFRAIYKSMLRNKIKPEYTDEEIARRQRQALIAKASTLTVSSFVIIVIFVLTIFFGASANYISGVSSSVKSWLKQYLSNEQTSEQVTKKDDSFGKAIKIVVSDKTKNVKKNKVQKSVKSSPSSFVAVVGNLEQLKPKLENMPIIGYCVDKIADILNDPDMQKELLTILFRRSGGIFSFTGGVISSFVSFLLNALLAIFFFSLFLSKMAEFIHDNKNQKKKKSEYLIRSIFNNKWLPGTNENTFAQAQEIILQVISKLKIWLKGYLTLICLDTVVYSIAFYLLGVPYAFILAFIAACGILLPYIGPIASAILTLLVTLAVGHNVTMTQLVLIVCVYIIEDGILEQLFFYPAIIGESLGLSTLETIIVVLLGGIFAGITGMIFAIPTAAILKYLIPKIYNCWSQ